MQAQETPILLSSWMEQNGVSRFEQANMVRRLWLTRLANGVYHFQGFTPSLYAVLHSYISLQGADFAIGASTALSIRGSFHYAYMGNAPIFLHSPSHQHFPSWLSKSSLGEDLVLFSTKIFSNSSVGVELTRVEGFDIYVSSPERAFMECLHLSPKYYNLLDLYYTMEMLTTLRPRLIQELLETCTSIKVKRLFLYMAEKTGFPWFKALKPCSIDIGRGVRSFADNGVYVPKYQIVIPKELDSYE